MRYYLYALIDTTEQPELNDISAVANPAANLQKIEVGNISAIVSPFELDEIISTRRHMLAHTKALETVMQQCTILPFSFGTIVDDIVSIENLVGMNRERLDADLKALQGSIEVGVKISWHEDRIFTELMSENTDISRKAAALKTRPATETYYARIELGREIENAIKAKKAAESEQLIDRLRSFSGISVLKDATSEMVILDAAFLIKADQEATLLEELEKIDLEKPGRLKLKVISPAPPYNFVSLKFRTEDKVAA